MLSTLDAAIGAYQQALEMLACKRRDHLYLLGLRTDLALEWARHRSCLGWECAGIRRQS